MFIIYNNIKLLLCWHQWFCKIRSFYKKFKDHWISVPPYILPALDCKDLYQYNAMSGTSKKRFPSLLAISWEKPWQRDSGGRGRWWQHKQQPFLSTTFLRVCVCQNSASKSEINTIVSRLNILNLHHICGLPGLSRAVHTTRPGGAPATWWQGQSGEAGMWSEASEFLNYDIYNIRKVTVSSLNKFQ